MREKIYQFLPHFFQNILVTIFNYKANKIRYRGKYQYYKQLFDTNKQLTLKELKQLQSEKYSIFINHAIKNAPYFKNTLLSGSEPHKIENIGTLPILSKETIRQNLHGLYTISKKDAIISKTGGTTGKSLEVYFTKRDFQERTAMLDNFRSNFGYELGKKTAWFSGKNILTKRDVEKRRFWKKDYCNTVKYYSTFHIKTDYLKYYIEDLKKFQPEFLVGFPSNILEIANFGKANNLKFPEGIVKAIFPTAETVTKANRLIIEEYFNCGVYDQYASSEGAPFILECVHKKLHLELQSGVFEVLDAQDNPAKKGRLVVTSFTTHGTPLIRYDIGDSIELSEETCMCGNKNPLVKQILGRIDDYVYSPEKGKINLGNVSNTLKDTQGIIKFQAIQRELDHILIKLVIDDEKFNEKSMMKFRKNWIDRVGDTMKLEFEYVNGIKVEKSGKFRIVKNEIKHLLEN